MPPPRCPRPPPRVYAPASPLTTRSPPLRPAPLAPTAADVACHQRLRPLPQRQWSPCPSLQDQARRYADQPAGEGSVRWQTGRGLQRRRGGAPSLLCLPAFLSSPRAAARVRTRSRPDAEATTLCLPRLRPLIASNSTSTSSVREKGERGHRTPPTSMRQRRSMVAPLHSNPLAPPSSNSTLTTSNRRSRLTLTAPQPPE